MSNRHGPGGDHDDPYEGSFWTRVYERRLGHTLPPHQQLIYSKLLLLRSRVRAERGDPLFRAPILAALPEAGTARD